MATKRGKKGGSGRPTKTSNDDEGGYEHVIEFTPGAGFDIRNAAQNFSKMMEDMLQPLIIHLPHVSVEFEPGCTPKEIIDGFNQAMKHKFTIKHSNGNVEEP